jgi:hypothetical protein
MFSPLNSVVVMRDVGDLVCECHIARYTTYPGITLLDPISLTQGINGVGGRNFRINFGFQPV